MTGVKRGGRLMDRPRFYFPFGRRRRRPRRRRRQTSARLTVARPPVFSNTRGPYVEFIARSSVGRTRLGGAGETEAGARPRSTPDLMSRSL